MSQTDADERKDMSQAANGIGVTACHQLISRSCSSDFIVIN